MTGRFIVCLGLRFAFVLCAACLFLVLCRSCVSLPVDCMAPGFHEASSLGTPQRASSLQDSGRTQHPLPSKKTCRRSVRFTTCQKSLCKGSFGCFGSQGPCCPCQARVDFVALGLGGVRAFSTER